MNPSHHLAIHPPPSENHQLSFSPSTPRASLIRPGRSHSGTSLSSLFHRSIFNAASSPTIYLPIQINILCHASIFPPTFFAIVMFVDAHSPPFYLSTNVFHPISISTSLTELRFFCCTVRTAYANRFKSNYPTEKEPARLSVPSDWIGIIIFYSINPLFPDAAGIFLFV